MLLKKLYSKFVILKESKLYLFKMSTEESILSVLKSISLALIFCSHVHQAMIAREIYSDLNSRVKIETVLTGYIPENLINVDTPNLSDRRIDIGYRARKCPFWYGYKSAEKFLIGEHFIHYSQGTRLLNDISWREKDRLYGQDWIKFISNCKATLGTESGASIIDFTGEIEYDLNRFQAFHPLARFEDVPPVLLQNDGKLQIQVISPRCFEAAALKTVMVLYPGTYSDILIKDKHYIELKKDFSNFR